MAAYYTAAVDVTKRIKLDWQVSPERGIAPYVSNKRGQTDICIWKCERLTNPPFAHFG